MTTWRLLKREEPIVATAFPGDRYREVGTHESDASYWLGPDAPQQIGERFGAGEYLLFGEDNRANSLRIAARTVYYEVDEDEPETVEAVFPQGGPPERRRDHGQGGLAMLSAYRISGKVYIVSTRRVADPRSPRTLPLGSPALTPDEAVEFAEQILAAAIRPIISTPKR